MERGDGEGSRACHKRRLLLLRCIAAAALVGDTAAFVRVAHVGLSLKASPAFVPTVPVPRTMRHAEALASRRSPSLPVGPRDMGRRMAVGSVCMVGAGREDGLRIVEFGKNKGAREKGGDTSAQAGSTGGTLSRDRADVDAEVSRKAEVSKQTLDALSMASWWKHDPKHRTIVNEDDLVVDYDQMLGDGTYGEVFVANFISGEYKGKKAVAKRAKDGLQDPLDPVKYVKKERSKQMEEHDELAAAYLTTEGYVNDLVMESCPSSCAPYLGMMTKQNKRWLVWEFLEGTTLEDLLLECDECYSLQPLARALGITDLVDGDMPSLRNLVNKIAIQLLSHCRSLEQAGLAHRDIKPFNIFVTNEKLLLIDFGSAAAMGIRERVGYDYNKSPCDPRYAPPEQFIDEEEWAKYDVYCVGLILVRVLFPPLWSGQHFDEFSESYHNANYELDVWLTRLIQADEALEGANANEKKWTLPSLFSQKSEVDRRDQTYVELAEKSCNFPDDGSVLNMCAIKEGLEVLNVRQGGVCWETMRRVLARDPSLRMSSLTALKRVAEADRPEVGGGVEGKKKKSSSWINPFGKSSN